MSDNQSDNSPPAPRSSFYYPPISRPSDTKAPPGMSLGSVADSIFVVELNGLLGHKIIQTLFTKNIPFKVQDQLVFLIGGSFEQFAKLGLFEASLYIQRVKDKAPPTSGEGVRDFEELVEEMWWILDESKSTSEAWDKEFVRKGWIRFEHVPKRIVCGRPDH